MRKEIEVKAKVDDLNTLKQKFKKLGCVFDDPVEQHDTIFVDDDYGVFAESQLGKNLLRIREVNDKVFFTLKQPQKNDQDAIEYETEITDAADNEASDPSYGLP